jgi:hypothetical protein
MLWKVWGYRWMEFGVWGLEGGLVMRYEYILFLLFNGNRFLMKASVKEMHVGEAVSSVRNCLGRIERLFTATGSIIDANFSSEKSPHSVSSKEVPH